MYTGHYRVDHKQLMKQVVHKSQLHSCFSLGVYSFTTEAVASLSLLLVWCTPGEYDSNSVFSGWIELCCPPLFVSSITLGLASRMKCIWEQVWNVNSLLLTRDLCLCTQQHLSKLFLDYLLSHRYIDKRIAGKISGSSQNLNLEPSEF